jgi:hypothetical protein
MRRYWSLIVALCGVVGLLAMAGPAHALMISVEESIIWQTPSVFPGATFTGNSSFATGIFNSDQHFFQDGSFGAQTYTGLSPSNPAIPLRLGTSLIPQSPGCRATRSSGSLGA